MHVKLVDDTWRGGARRRFVSEVRTLTGALEGGRPVTHLVYLAPEGANPGTYHPDPRLGVELEPFAGVWEGRA